MKPFSIAGMQLELSALNENVTTMGIRLDVLMNVYPWVQMVVFSELSPYGPLLSNAVPFPAHAEEIFKSWAKRYGIWVQSPATTSASGRAARLKYQYQ